MPLTPEKKLPELMTNTPAGIFSSGLGVWIESLPPGLGAGIESLPSTESVVDGGSSSSSPHEARERESALKMAKALRKINLFIVFCF